MSIDYFGRYKSFCVAMSPVYVTMNKQCCFYWTKTHKRVYDFDQKVVILCVYGKCLKFCIIWFQFWLYTTIIADFAFFAIFDPNFEGFKIIGICSFAIPINKNMISTYQKRLIDFGQFGAFKCVPTEDWFFSLTARLSKISKIWKNDTKSVN